MTIRVAIKSDCESRAEKELFRMASLLSDDWLVWMNRELNFETPSGYMNREVDCIIYHPQHGMLLIECKSGMISAQHDSESCQLQWLQSGNLLKCSPMEQVRSLISPLHDYMKVLLKAPPSKEFYKVRVQWAVCFSDMSTMEGVPQAEIPRKRVILKTDLLDIKKFEKKLIEILELPEKKFNNLPYLNEQLDAEAFFSLQSFLDGEGNKPDAGDILKSPDGYLEQASEVQRMLMDSISENLRVKIKGVAGSGKSHMVVWEALRLSRLGKSVAIACYNDLLAYELKKSVEKALAEDGKLVKKKFLSERGVGYGRVGVLVYSEWCEKYVKAAKLQIKKNGDKSLYYDKELPLAFVRAEKILRKDKKHREGFFYDALIIDEGQDFTSEWVDSLISLLQNEEKGIVRFFYDPAQRLYGRRNGIDNPQVLSMPVMVLARGLRNTKKILEWVYKKTRFSLPCYSNMIQGPNVRELSYKDSVELERKLINYYEELVAKYKLLPSDILVVSLRSRKNSALKNLNDDRFVWNDVGRKCLVRDKVNIVSGHRIKGLDAMAVILVDAEEPESISDRTDWKRRLLVGATRAKKILCVFSKA